METSKNLKFKRQDGIIILLKAQYEAKNVGQWTLNYSLDWYVVQLDFLQSQDE